MTTNRRRDNSTAPRERQTVTIIGSISGVSPTATARANSSASCQLPWAQPFSTNTEGTSTATNRSISHVNCEMPRSKLLGGTGWRTASASDPRQVSEPVAITTPRAVPDSTLVPRKQRFGKSSGAAAPGGTGSADFSTGNDSPVRVDCDT